MTSGASADIQMATRLARMMATQFGMSEKLGPLAYAENEQEVFLGHAVARHQNVSEDTQRTVDEEIRIFVNEGYETAKDILTKHEDQLHAIANGLLEYETLSGDEIKDLLDGKPPIRDTDDAAPPTVSAVPKAGKGKADDAKKDRPGADDGGMEPQPT